MSKSRMSQQALAAALTTALLAFAAPSMALAQDEGGSDRSERSSRRSSTREVEREFGTPVQTPSSPLRTMPSSNCLALIFFSMTF